VHGNLPALEAALEHAATFAPGLVAHAGDMINGPASAEVMDRLMDDGCLGVYGNHEDYMLRCNDPDAPARWSTERFASGQWTKAALSSVHLSEIASWPVVRRVHPEVTIVHGSTASLGARFADEVSDDDVRSMYSDIPTPVIVCGHTHLPHTRTLDGKTIVNVGSTGVPHDGSCDAKYVMLVKDEAGGWRHEQHRAPYDPDIVLRMARESGWLADGHG